MAISSAQDIVQPRNTAIPQSAIDALTDSFRKGQITVADIMARKQERDKSKIELQTLQQAQSEMMDPSAVAARQAQTQLAGATAQSGLELVQPRAEAEKTKLELQAAEAKFGPGIKLWQTLAPEAGVIDQPALSDGRPDYAKMAEVGLLLAAQKVRKQRAVERLQGMTLREGESNGTKVILKFNNFGEHITPELEVELRQQASEPLRLTDMKPGTAQVQPATTAQTPLVQPAAATTEKPTVVPTGQNLPGVGMAVGAAPVPPEKLKAPTEAQQRAQLALSRFAQSNDMIQALKDAGYDPTTTTSWIDGMLPEVLKSGDRKSYDAAISAWSQGLLRLESGAAISPREKTWYDKSFFPQVGDTPVNVVQKEQLRAGIEQMVAEMAQAGGVISPESIEQTKRIYAQADQLGSASPGASAPATSKVANIPGIGNVRRLPDGSYERVP